MTSKASCRRILGAGLRPPHAIRTRSIRVEGALLKDLTLKDEGDRRLVEAAVEGNATYVVTADQEVLRHRGYGETEFVTPAELLRLLAS